MKKRKKLNILTPLILGTCLLTLVACGSDDDDDGGIPPTQGEEQPAPTPDDQQAGTYRVNLTPVNGNVSGLVTGTGEIKIEGDNFQVDMKVNNAPDSGHIQHVHIGKGCPEPSADTNADGFVDVVEAEASSGKILIPLDDDLRSQSAGGKYPSGATYNYSESTSFLAMLADLKLPDDDATDAITKLGLSDNLDLAGKVVTIHGVPNSIPLPGTVKSIGDLPANETLPIACGVITKVQAEDTGTTTGGTTGTTTGGTTGTTTGGTTGTTTGGTTGGTGTTGDTGTTTTGGTGTATTTGI